MNTTDPIKFMADNNLYITHDFTDGNTIYRCEYWCRNPELVCITCDIFEIMPSEDYYRYSAEDGETYEHFCETMNEWGWDITISDGRTSRCDWFFDSP